MTLRKTPRSLLIMDEIDSVGQYVMSIQMVGCMYNNLPPFRSRSKDKSEASGRLLGQILNEAQNLSSGTLVVACTNCPHHLDAALVRRFKQLVKIPLPDRDCRKKILENLLSGT